MTLRSYDLNTNIKSFSRRGFLYGTSASKYYGLLDSLTAYYGGNQVRIVTDAVTTDYGHPAEYRDGEATWYEHNHDKNGNLVCDLDRGVTSIGYNILNLPEKVLLPGNHETYNIYDADGRKLRTVHIVIYDEVVTPGGETIIPADILVRDYSGGHIYENGVLERTLTPTGYYSAADSEYCHYIKDYQGNNIAVVKADANGAPEVVSATLMYPFGGELTEMSATDRYRFGGKEFDTRGGLFHYDFGARHYDPVLPMFNGYDPMAEKYPHLSPYAYCAGNPVRYIDPSGEVITICGEVYDPNKDYSDASEFVQNIVYALQLSSKYGSEELVDDLINSKNTYDFTLSTNDKSFTNFEKGSNSVTVYLRDGGTNFVVNNAIHEEMHLAQIENGQGGETVYNEIEAFAFQNIVINNSRPNDKSVISSVSDIFNEQQMNAVFLRIGEQDYSVIDNGIQIFRQTITGKKPEYRDIKEYPIGYKKNLLQHYNIKDR